MSVGGGGCSMGSARTFREAASPVRMTLVEPPKRPLFHPTKPAEAAIRVAKERPADAIVVTVLVDTGLKY